MAFNALAAALLLGVGMAQAATYRTVDSEGRVHYSDKPPTTFQKSGGEELNKQGQVIKRTPSDAERKAEAARQEEQKQIRLEKKRQAQRDRALTSTYTSEEEIDLARDRALEHHKLAIKGAETRSVAVENNLKSLRDRIAGIEKSGRKVGPGLQQQLDQANRESLELKRVVLSNEEAMEDVREKYAADKARFRELTARP
jgi:hypothetical protein